MEDPDKLMGFLDQGIAFESATDSGSDITNVDLAKRTTQMFVASMLKLIWAANPKDPAPVIV